MNKIKLSILLLITLSGVSQAGSYKSCASVAKLVDPNNANRFSQLEYGNASAGYGTACHETNAWQQIGDNWDKETGNNIGSDSGDNGIDWSTSSDGGKTWGSWTNSSNLSRGDKVKFRVKTNRSTNGNHEYDQVKSWMDWNQDKTWDSSQDGNGVDNNEVVLSQKWMKNHDANDVLNANSNEHNTHANINGKNNSDTSKWFFQTIDIPLDAVLGETWMRTRIACEESIVNHTVHGIMQATGFLNQGEVQDNRFVITAKTTPPVPVPEPSTLLIFALGLTGLALKRKK